MKKNIYIRVTKGQDYYVAECLDLPVVTQAKTLDELAENIKEAVGLHLEGEDLAELDLVSDPSIIINMELESLPGVQA